MAVSAFQDRFVDLDGPVHYREWLGPETLTFVCLHAIGGSHLHWGSVAPSLARHGRVLAPDLPGFGLSPRGGRSASLPANQRLLSRFLVETAPHNAVVVGHSMGGGLGILQAALEPGSVAGLVLSSSSLPPARAGASDGRAFAWYLAHRARMRGEALLRGLGHAPRMGDVVRRSLQGAAADPSSIDAEFIRASVELARTAQSPRDAALAFAQAAGSTFSLLSHGERFRHLLDRITCPVLLVHGDLDRTVPVEFAQRVARDHPQWRLDVLPKLGHLLQWESSDRWVAAVEEWLPSVGAEGGRVSGGRPVGVSERADLLVPGR